MSGEVEEIPSVRISLAGLRRLLRRVGFLGPSLHVEFLRWAEVSLPLDMRPVGIEIGPDYAEVAPASALEVLIDEARGRQSPWAALGWATLAAGVGAVVYAVVDRALQRRR